MYWLICTETHFLLLLIKSLSGLWSNFQLSSSLFFWGLSSSAEIESSRMNTWTSVSGLQVYHYFICHYSLKCYGFIVSLSFYHKMSANQMLMWKACISWNLHNANTRLSGDQGVAGDLPDWTDSIWPNANLRRIVHLIVWLLVRNIISERNGSFVNNS